ncbi:DNA-directed RNA polymerase-like protein, partial [Leptotrombidium deliense]
NGLQHYAALGRDEIGAVSVNLAPSERPNDVYSDVAAEVEKLRQSDTESSVAKTLEGFVNRKVIKQTVMTYVYGVTRYGAKLQITKRLKEDETFPQDHCWTASLYLTHKTFDSIQNMFNATRKIQDWFTNCARTISNVLASPVEWITPLGFPIVQPYFKKSSNAIKKKDGILSLKTDHSRWKPNTLKQKNAFPPNFIHSLDSSHMMLTALHCEKEGITFAAVHDSYWTHPCNIDDMNRICREQFVALHSEPILSDLSKFMVEKYEPLLGKMYDENSEEYTKILDLLKSVPETGSFDLTNVMKSTYFFS